MLVYDGLKSNFIEDIERNDIAQIMAERMLAKLGRHTPVSEFASWANSLHYMYEEVFVQEKFPQFFKSILLDEYMQNKTKYEKVLENKDWLCTVLGNVFFTLKNE